MNKISTPSLFHYTRSIHVIKLILENGLRFGQLEEEIPLSGYANNIFDQLPGVVKHVQSREVICLCDLPLSSAEHHRREYGNYALGFTKEWGMRVGASPVRYVHRGTPDIGSEFFTTILDLPSEINKRGTIYDLFANFMGVQLPAFSELPDDHRKIFQHVDQLCRELLAFCDFSTSYLRLHDGDWLDRSSGETTHRVFYDEREWRVVRSPGKDQFVKFVDDDLRHILVQSDDERDELIEYTVGMCPELKIKQKDRFSRKVKTFSETLDDV